MDENAESMQTRSQKPSEPAIPVQSVGTKKLSQSRKWPQCPFGATGFSQKSSVAGVALIKSNAALDRFEAQPCQ
jgi:hypothetical protein